MYRFSSMNMYKDVLINIKAFLWIDVQITHSKSCFISTQNDIRQMRHEGSKGSLFFSMCNTCKPLFSSVSRRLAVSCCDEHMYILTHHWFHKLWRLRLSLQSWPDSCDILQHNQCYLHQRGRRRGGERKCSPKSSPLSTLASVSKQPVVRRGCFSDQRLPLQERLEINLYEQPWQNG